MIDWEVVSGQDLLGPSSSVIPECPGLYMWSRHFAPPAGAYERKEGFLDWLAAELGTPYCVVKETELTPYLRIGSLTVGGRPLDESKVVALQSACDSRSFRRLVGELVRRANENAPALYVGRAIDLRKRIQQHLRYETDFAQKVDSLELTWDQLTLRYACLTNIAMPNDHSETQVLDLLEAILTGLVLGTMVSRIG